MNIFKLRQWVKKINFYFISYIKSFKTIHSHPIVIVLLFYYKPEALWVSLVAQQQRIHLLMQETWVQSLSWEDPLEKEMATHSSILAWEIPCTEEPGGLQFMGPQKSQTRLSN